MVVAGRRRGDLAHRSDDARALHLEARERCKEALALVRVLRERASRALGGAVGELGELRGDRRELMGDRRELSGDRKELGGDCESRLREPAELGAAVEHAHLHLEDDCGLAGLARVVQGRRAVEGRRHEGALDTAAHALLEQASREIR